MFGFSQNTRAGRAQSGEPMEKLEIDAQFQARHRNDDQEEEDKQQNQQMQMRKELRRGDGLGDFIQVKGQFYKFRDEFYVIEKRLKSLEELFHKQSLLTHSNDLVTNPQLQSYLDALSAHLDRHLSERLAAAVTEMQGEVGKVRAEVKEMVRDKASKGQLQRQNNYILEIVRGNESKLDQILHGYEVVIDKKIEKKAESRDVEALDIAKADISAVEQVMEKVHRIELLINEGLGLSLESDQDQEGSNYSNDEVDPEELKDQVNNSAEFKKHHQSTASLDQQKDLKRQDSQFSREDSQEEQNKNEPHSPFTSQINKSVNENKQRPVGHGLVSDTQLYQHHKDKGGKDKQHLTAAVKHPHHRQQNHKMTKTQHQCAQKKHESGLVIKDKHENLTHDENDHPPLIGTNKKQSSIHEVNKHTSGISPFDQQPSLHQSGFPFHAAPHQTPVVGGYGPSTFKSGQPVIIKFDESERVKVQTSHGVNDSSLKSNQLDITPKSSSNTRDQQASSMMQKRPSTEREDIKLEGVGQVVPTIGVKIKLSGRRERVETSSNQYDNEMTESVINKDRTPKDFMSNASSTLRNTSKLGSASPRRRTMMKQVLKKNIQNTDNIQEIENLKKELFLSNQKVKEIYDLIKAVENEFRPSINYVLQHQNKINSTMKSYDLMAGKIQEQETYDDKLKQKYLKQTIKQVNDLKKEIDKDQGELKELFKVEKETTRVKLKTLETDVVNLKSAQDFIRKQLQQQRLFGNYSAQNSDASVFMTQEGGSARSALNNSALMNQNGNNPVQIVMKEIMQVQSEVEYLKSFLLQKIQSVILEVEEIKVPFRDAIQDLKKENEAFMREIDRYDALYRNMLNDYMVALDENKKYIEKQQELEHKLSTQSNYINNATIQVFNNGHSVSSGTPIHNTRLCSLMGDHGNPDFRCNNPLTGKMDSVVARMVEAKRKLKASFEQETLDASLENQQQRAKTTIGGFKQANELMKEYELTRRTGGGGQAASAYGDRSDTKHQMNLDKYKRMVQRRSQANSPHWAGSTTISVNKEQISQNKRGQSNTANNSPLRSIIGGESMSIQTPVNKVREKFSKTNEIKISLKRFNHIQ